MLTAIFCIELKTTCIYHFELCCIFKYSKLLMYHVFKIKKVDICFKAYASLLQIINSETMKVSDVFFNIKAF